jgi:hypothetical protein
MSLMFKSIIKRFPLINKFVQRIYFPILKRQFPGSKEYWIRRYADGGASGPGTFRKFKAEVINAFVEVNEIQTIIEYGCGDGNQLKLAKYPHYIGFDVSSVALDNCRRIFHDDDSKHFKQMKDYNGERAELTLSLDVIYHLIEDEVFEMYMRRLFNSSDHFVMIYSTNTDTQPKIRGPHIKHRKFTKWIGDAVQGWRLIRYIPNQPPQPSGTKRLLADFFIYEKNENTSI